MMTSESLPVQEERPSSLIAKIAGVIALFTVLFLMLGFDWIREGAGRYWIERNIPSPLTVAKVKQVYGEPDKDCKKSVECAEFIAAFRYRRPVPEHSGYIAYTEDFPILPILIFYLDDQENIIGFDTGVH